MPQKWLKRSIEDQNSKRFSFDWLIDESLELQDHTRFFFEKCPSAHYSSLSPLCHSLFFLLLSPPLLSPPSLLTPSPSAFLQVHYFSIKIQDDPCNCLQRLGPNEKKKQKNKTKHIALVARRRAWARACECFFMSGRRASTEQIIFCRTCPLHPLNLHLCECVSVCVRASLPEAWPMQIIFSQTLVPPF